MKSLTLFLLLSSIIFQVKSQTPEWLWAKNHHFINGFDMATDNSGNIYLAGAVTKNTRIGQDSLITNDNYLPLLIKYQPDGSVLWTKTFTTNAKNRNAGFWRICHDNDNIYVCGFFADTLFYPSGYLVSSGGTDGFLAKFDSDGNMKWIKKLGGHGENFVNDIAADHQGNLWVAGYYRISAEFDTITLSNPMASYSVYLAKYDNAGKLLILKHYSGDDRLYINAIDCSKNGEPVIAGSFSGTVEWDGIKLINKSLTNEFTDLYLVKFNSIGTAVWAQQAAGSFDDEVRDVKVAKDNSIYITGTFKSSLNFVAFILSSAGNTDAFVAKYNPNGIILWGKSDGGTSLDAASRLVVDRQGAVYVFGSYDKTATFGNFITLKSEGENDLFITKYDASGSFQWVKELKNLYDISENQIILTPKDRILVLGHFRESLTFKDSLIFSPTLYDYDMFIAELDKSTLPDFIPENQKFSHNHPIVFPNPSSGKFMISLQEDGEYYVCDLYGKTIETFYGRKDENVVLSLPERGVYLVKHKSLSLTSRIIVQ